MKGQMHSLRRNSLLIVMSMGSVGARDCCRHAKAVGACRQVGTLVCAGDAGAMWEAQQ